MPKKHDDIKGCMKGTIPKTVVNNDTFFVRYDESFDSTDNCIIFAVPTGNLRQATITDICNLLNRYHEEHPFEVVIRPLREK